MKKTNLLFTFLLSLLTVQYGVAQYCAGGPSSGFDSNMGQFLLTGENSTSIDYTPPCNGIIGLDDQTALSIDANAGTMYSGTVTWGTCGGNFGNAATIWIDFNMSFTFDPGEAVHTWSGTPTVAEGFSFTVPADAVNGAQRIRVNQQEGGSLPLDPCDGYTWGSSVDFTINISGGTGTPPPPPPPPYCSAGPSSTFDSNMGQFVLNGESSNIDYTPPCNGLTGVDDQQANQIADLLPGSTYSIDVTWGTCGGNFGNAASIWVDWNDNLVFDAGEVIHTWSGTPTVMETVSFTVPLTATPGQTGMRAMQREGGSLPLDPCGTYTWGSVVDFGIQIINPCPAPTMVSISDTTDVSAVVNFDDGGNSATVEVTAAGAGPGTGTVYPGASSPLTLPGLSPETDYEVYLQNDCGLANPSDLAGPFAFTTLATCDPPVSVSISDIGTTSAVVNFDTGGEPANVEVTAAGAGQGTGTVATGVTSPYTIMGLDANTSYDVYVQTACGTGLLSVWDGPYNFTTLLEPTISLIDEDGDGIPNINDPCACNDPENVVDPVTNVVTHFHDFVTIVSNPGESWTLAAVNSGQVLDMALNPLPIGTAIPEVSPGVYHLDFWHPETVGFNADFSNGTNTLNAASACDGVACAASAIPTMGQWGMMLFAVIMLSFGLVFVMRQQVALAGVGTSTSFGQGIPFEKSIFGKALVVVMLGLALTFAVAILAFGYEMTNADVPGSLLFGPALAYLAHLVILAKKEK